MQRFSGASALKLTTSFLALGALLSADIALAQVNDDEIIVTARKQSETALEAPIAITAFSEQALDDYGIEDLRQVADFTPGLQLNADFGRNAERPVIRGLANLRNETPQPVSVFIDGVYIRQGITSSIIDNVSRIEVLKGPQSSLYGRSTYGGVINYVTKTPGEEFGGKLNISAATDEEYILSGYIDGPLNESGTIRGTLGGRYSEYGGFDNQAANQGSRDLGEEKTKAVYGKLYFNPVDNFSAQISVNYNEDRDGQFAGALVEGPFNSQDADSPCPELTRRAFCGTLQAPDEINVATGFAAGTVFNPAGGSTTAGFDFDAGLDRDIFRIGMNIAYETENGYTIESLTGFTAEDTRVTTNQTYSDVIITSPFGRGFSVWGTEDFDERQDVYQEFRLSSPTGGQFEWLVGGIYYNNDRSNVGRNINVATLTRGDGEQEQEIAGFARLGYNPSDNLSIGLEGRYYSEDVTQVNSSTGAPNRTATFDGFSPRVTVDYTLADGSLLYAVAARGNKRGGFNRSDVPEPNDTFNEEIVWSYEAGLKSQAIDNLTFTVAGFYNTITDQQLSQLFFFPAPQTGQTTIVNNIGKSRIYGMEFDGRYDVTDNFYIRGTYALADTEITEGSDPTQGGFFASDTLVGFEVPRVSKHSATFTAEYTGDFNAGNDEFFIRGDVLYNSGRLMQLQNIVRSPNATTVNVRAGIRKDDWEFSVFGRNITDEDAPGGAFRYVNLRDFGFFGRGTNVAFLRRGAQVGARVIYDF